MNTFPRTVLFAGGGTGGHVYPALAIADAVRERNPDTVIVFIGTPDRIEARVVPARGYRFETISIGGWSRGLSVRTLMFPFRVAAALVRSRAIIRRLRPSVVVGTGGFVSGPPLFAASWMGIPTLVHEQNSVPGLATRLLARRATEVHVTFEQSRRILRSRGKVLVTGNPTRSAIGSRSRTDAAAALQLDASAPTVLVFGGSQGAASLNAALRKAAPELAREGIQILWATGERNFPDVRREFMESAGHLSARVHIMPYIEDMENAYAVCDVAVTRAGATTLAELMRAGVPSILVPLPHAAADHQTQNARTLEEAGAAVLLPDAEAGSRLTDTIRSLLADRTRLRDMAAKTRALETPRAAETLADAVLRLAESSHG